MNSTFSKRTNQVALPKIEIPRTCSFLKRTFLKVYLPEFLQTPCLMWKQYLSRYGVSNILQSKDIILASLIMPQKVEDQRVTDSEGRCILLNQNQDARLLRNLTLNDFIISFLNTKTSCVRNTLQNDTKKMHMNEIS